MSEISRIDFFKAISPLSRPLSDSTHSISEISFIIARIELENGVTGDAYLLSFQYSPQAILGALRDLRAFALGWEVSATGALAVAYEKETEYFGTKGPSHWALGILNVAMWDAWGKILGQPVWKLFGAFHDRVPLYGSGGWLSYSMDELLAEARGYVDRGFWAVKIKVGSPSLEQDLERLSRVREIVGPHIRIMMDANQGMTVHSALALAKAVKPLNIEWFEEPLPNTDFDGYATLRSKSGMSLAMGERQYDGCALKELVRRNAVDVWQPDIMRLGGVEAWRSTSAFANENHLPVLSHFYKEYDVPLLTSVRTIAGSDSFDWVDGLITNPIRIEEGYAYPNEGPGWGFQFKDDHLTWLA